MATLVLVVLDGAIANVALPTLATTLRVSAAASVWVVNGYQLALVMTLLPCAALGESLGLRRVFIIGVALFTAASLLCRSVALAALAGGGPLRPGRRRGCGVGARHRADPLHLPGAAARRHHRLERHRDCPVGCGRADDRCRHPFRCQLALAVRRQPARRGGRAVARPRLPRPPGTARRIDRASAALNALGFATLILGVARITTEPVLASALLVVAVISFVVLVRREMPRSAPLVPLHLLRARPFRISVLASVCCFAGQMASYVALPFHLQHALGQSDLATGLLMTPWPLVVAVAGPLSGRLADRVSNGLLCAVGGVFLAAGLAIAAALPVAGSLVPLEGCLMLGGLGFGLFQTPNNRNMLLSAPKERSGAVGGMQATARLLGQTIGSVLMALLFTVASTAAALRIGLAVGAALTLAGGLVSAMRIGATPPPVNVGDRA